jgi:hypothetical protein
MNGGGGDDLLVLGFVLLFGLSLWGMVRYKSGKDKKDDNQE